MTISHLQLTEFGNIPIWSYWIVEFLNVISVVLSAPFQFFHTFSLPCFYWRCCMIWQKVREHMYSLLTERCFLSGIPLVIEETHGNNFKRSTNERYCKICLRREGKGAYGRSTKSYSCCRKLYVKERAKWSLFMKIRSKIVQMIHRRHCCRGAHILDCGSIVMMGGVGLKNCYLYSIQLTLGFLVFGRCGNPHRIVLNWHQLKAK